MPAPTRRTTAVIAVGVAAALAMGVTPTSRAIDAPLAPVTETVFAIPGIGRLVIDAVQHHDYPVIQSVLLISAGAYVLINLLIDLSYRLFDPRIRY